MVFLFRSGRYVYRTPSAFLRLPSQPSDQGSLDFEGDSTACAEPRHIRPPLQTVHASPKAVPPPRFAGRERGIIRCVHCRACWRIRSVRQGNPIFGQPADRHLRLRKGCPCTRKAIHAKRWSFPQANEPNDHAEFLACFCRNKLGSCDVAVQ